MAEQYAFDLRRLGGFKTRVATSGAEALDILTREVVDCVILDLEMPDLDGFGVLRSLEHKGILVPVIVYTGTGSYRRCAKAIRLGAFSFVDKAEPMERVVHEVRLALRQADLEEQVVRLEKEVSEPSPLIGKSEAMNRLRDAIRRLADIPSPVLILGESGTGKELVARELHRQSRRREEAFVAVNCGGMSEGLVDSDLFGHERGAFTGALKARRGAFERASEGTLFLDEIGELGTGMQARLLRILEDGKVFRLGAEKPVGVGSRVVAATHRDLDEAVEKGSFREDLLFRLNVHVIRVPPLRERRDDIRRLATHFANSLASRLGRASRPISEAAMSVLQSRRWDRNNVREVKNTIERMIIASDGALLDLEHLPPDLGQPRGRWRHGGPASQEPRGPGSGTYREQKQAAERRIVIRSLEAHGWKIGITAEALGLADHSSLLKIMQRLGVRRP